MQMPDIKILAKHLCHPGAAIAGNNDPPAASGKPANLIRTQYSSLADWSPQRIEQGNEEFLALAFNGNDQCLRTFQRIRFEYLRQ